MREGNGYVMCAIRIANYGELNYSFGEYGICSLGPIIMLHYSIIMVQYNSYNDTYSKCHIILVSRMASGRRASV